MAKIDLPTEVENLITELKRLPGIGLRSAQRMAIWLLQHKKANPLRLAEVLSQASSEVAYCSQCGFFKTKEPCSVCHASNRDHSLICVVKEAVDVLPLEKSGVFQGYYHCLGGKLSPLDGVGPEDLRIQSLVSRVQKLQDSKHLETLDKTQCIEVVLALGSDVEGEATANYLKELLLDLGCQVTSLAQGLPAGSGLEYVDELTLHHAFKGRN